MKRTEDEIVAMANIKVILGGKEFEIAPLVIRDSREWRRKVVALISPLPSMVKVTMDDTEDFGKVLTQIMVTNPDQVIQLFFEYAKNLNQEEIEAVATDAEMAAAFQEVIQVAFPLAESPMKIMARLSQQEAPSSS